MSSQRVKREPKAALPRYRHRRRFLYAVLLAVLLAAPGSAFGDDLDDISIQVIGLDEIPEQALERIPMPSPDYGGLSDIHQDIIPHQSTPASDPTAAIINPPPTDSTSGGGGTGTAQPTTP